MSGRTEWVRTSQAKLSSRERIILRWAGAVFLAILADGALRKWLLPASWQVVPYFAKDVLAALFVLAYRPRKEAPWAKHLMPFALGIGVCLTPAFLTGLGQVPAGAIVVFKNAVLWPVFAIQMGSCLTHRVIERLARLALVSSVLMAGLAVAQYFGGSASPLNRYAWEDTALLGGIAVAGDFVRATGTFSYLTGLVSFSMTMFCLFLGRSLTSRSGSELWFGVTGMMSAAVCGLVTGSRGIQVFMAAIATICVILTSKKQGMRLSGGILGIGIVITLLWNSSLSEGVVARWNATVGGEVGDRIAGTGQPITETLSEKPFGIGLGIYTGIAASEGIQNGVDFAYNESGLNKIAAEAGVAGGVAILLALGLLIRISSWTLAADSVRKSRVLPIAVGALIQVAIGIWYDHSATGLWWWIIAIWLGDVMAGRSMRQPTLRLRRPLEMALASGG